MKAKTKHTYNRANQLAYKYLKQVQKAIIHLNAFGFTVLNIDFTGIKPRIEVDIGNSQEVADELIKQRKAMWYAQGYSERLGRCKGYYTMLEGIRVYWESEA
ncbi:hypothetical protein [Otariodibacter oris]|uniref:Uncharacterized protein n=1 Tax=Otariodibacter oris TaxID=1032623 RepID=A0A420XIT0_9PAST|nr:hypothetical protein [Otariodibacter oris]QGM80692.1 hypothetical protein A6A10_04370 [Otariodibacter oris]RKR77146.1 hypothetical protein DES31_0471 [Otariodibacter oris]